MARMSDPTATGWGGPGYRFDDANHAALVHDGPGVSSMASAGPVTHGSPFLITFTSTPRLARRHAVFRRVDEGLDERDAIPRVEPVQPGGVELELIASTEMLARPAS